ncbi:helix-turn-helix domain-containing protein [Mycobacterium sp. DL592]|uniref:winged helix-turn-helix transcriptional regulator n=1 Tax=Mycobacterium sp. DL592 TaxID=2675524 RepID=UPI0014202817|nr:helix-turn-helix domain-containing protein [Mycobacterium sp. DL592]
MTTRTVTVIDNCATTYTPDGLRVAAGEGSDCRIVRDILSQLGDKWTLMVILCLSSGSLRFNAVQRAVVGISHRMLTVTLRKLERDGLVRRTVHPEAAPHTEYELTPLGVSFTEPVMAVANWAVAAQPHIEQNRQRFHRT